MPGFGVCRANIDSAGGVILVGNPTVFLDGFPISIEGNPVEGHGNGEHNGPVMVQGNPNFIIGGTPVCTVASQASCGHTPSGSSTFFVG
jgi:uncharacterized Zn-binding protein involved in type VI secretion